MPTGAKRKRKFLSFFSYQENLLRKRFLVNESVMTPAG
jgi:hypothetical protein